MPTFKFKTDDKGDFYSDKDTFPLTQYDMVMRDPDNVYVTVKLLKPKDAHIKVLTLTINKKTRNVEVSTGKTVKVGTFPLVEGKNSIKFEGESDQPGEPHEIEVVPLLLP